MSLILDPAATRVFLAKGVADLKIKKSAMRLADRMGALLVGLIGKEYLLYNLRASTIAKNKDKTTLEPDDVAKALNNLGFGDLVSVFKKGAEEGIFGIIC